MLNAKGVVYVVGVVDGRDAFQRVPIHGAPKPLTYPSIVASRSNVGDSNTAIRQFSTGRQHVLAITDSGCIWSWANADQPGLHVDLSHHDVLELANISKRGAVRKVVAGWNKSAALVNGIGIVVWTPLRVTHGQDDTSPVLRSAIVPNTSERRSSSHSARVSSDGSIGEVCNFVVLERSIIFNTHLGQVFQSCITDASADQLELSIPTELILQQEASITVDETFVTDVQGSFRSFALFTKSGAVLTSNESKLSTEQPFDRFPALQDRGVISLAFGDYHFHALHSNGHITSYGDEPSGLGAFGLGFGRESGLRGIYYTRRPGMGGNHGSLVRHAYREGRRIWFEPEKRAWIRFLARGGADPDEASERMALALRNPSESCQGEVSDWIEQEGRDWETKYQVQDGQDDSACAYFALSVAAAGWHSGALILVDEDRAQKVKNAVEIKSTTRGLKISTRASNKTWWDLSWIVDWLRWWVEGSDPNSSQPVDEAIRAGAMSSDGSHYIWSKDHFPRLRLSDGTEMPGAVPFNEWRYGQPQSV